MNKKAKIIALVLGILIVLIFTSLLISGSMNQEKDTETSIINHTLTKAICSSDNYCQDYIISCHNESVVRISPITGVSVHFSDDWTDTRSEEKRERLC